MLRPSHNRTTIVALFSVALAACGNDASRGGHPTTCVGLCVPPSIEQSAILGGQYGYKSATVHFQSTYDSSGNAVAKFWLSDPGNPIALATINDGSTGSLTLNSAAGSFTYTGHESSLTSGASAALRDFNLSDAGVAVANVPYAVGEVSQFVVPQGATDSQLQTITNNAQVTAKFRAALVLPVQLQAWLDPTFVAPTPTGYPATQGLNIDDDGNPYVLGYWTLGDGSNLSDATYTASSVATGDPSPPNRPEAVGSSPGYASVCQGTPQASFCRGACGVNCAHCTKSSTQACNAATMMIEQTDTYTCPTAPCCVSHDTCYDNCKLAYNCGQKAPGARWNWNRAKLFACQRGCDYGCIQTWGTVLCGMHIFGGGGTSTTTFTNTYSVGPCES